MGKGKRRASFRFELHDSTQHPLPSLVAPRHPPPPPRARDEWDRVELLSVCELLPSLAPLTVARVLARERQAGSSVEAAIDGLLSLQLRDSTPQLEQSPLSTPTQGEGRTEEAPWLARLPDEILGMLWEQLSLLTVGKLRMVCKACHSLTTRWLAQVETCRIGKHTSRWHDDRVISLLTATRGARRLLFEGKSLPSFTSFPRLLQLPLASSLLELRLADCAQLESHHLLLLCTRCRRLTTLEICGCPSLADGALVVLSSLPQLRTLALTRMAQLSASSLRRLVRRCVQLDSADFSYSGEGVTNEALSSRQSSGGGTHKRRPPDAQRGSSSGSSVSAEEGWGGGWSLELLADVGGEDLGEAVWAEAGGWGSSLRCGWEPLGLRILSVRGWSSITQLELMAAEGLESLNVSDCKQLLSLRLATPLLSRLSANGCTSLVTVDLRCPRLSQLLLSMCKRLQLLQLACPAPLSHLNLHSCREVGVPALSTLLQTSGAALETLDLNGAIGTEEASEAVLRMWCPALIHLDTKGRTRKY